MQIRRAQAVPVTRVALTVTAEGSGHEPDPSNAEMRIAIHEDPGSLDPALASEPDSGNVVLNLLDPQVRLNDDLEPEAALAQTWRRPTAARP